jgi:hypothetical protein
VGGTHGCREEVGKGYRRVNILQILYTDKYKWKTDTCSKYSRNRSEGIKENDGGGESKYDIYLIQFENFCKCHNDPHPAQQQEQQQNK